MRHYNLSQNERNLLYTMFGLSAGLVMGVWIGVVIWPH